MYLQVNTLNKLVPYATQQFINNLPAIFAKTFNHALLKNASKCSNLLKLYKNVAVKHVFSHPNVKQLKLQGYRVISKLLKIYRPLLSLSLSNFTKLVKKKRVKRFPIKSRLFHKLSTRHRLTYVKAVSKLPSNSPKFPL